MDEFAIHTNITIDDFEYMLKIIESSIKTADNMNIIKQHLELYQKIEDLVKQFHSEKGE